MKNNKTIGIWLRVSTEFQVKDDSPEHHEKRARLYAEAKGWNVAEVYRLDAVSGKSVMEHPETKRMLRDLRNGKITGLIFSKLARLARNAKELLEFAEIFKEHNSDLISLAENIDTSTPSGKLFYTLFAALAEWERSEIAERVAASVPIRAKLGKPLGGQASFGYKWNGKELIIEEKEAPIRKLVYELFIEHKRKGTVAKALNDKGYRTRNGSFFTDTTVGRLLRDPMAKGERRANYTKSLGEGKSWIIKPQSEWVSISCPSVVESNVWDECNRILDEQEKKKKKPGKKPVHLFTGIVYCQCGTKMYIPSDSKKYICYKCRKNRIDMTDLEEIYYENLKTFLLTDEQVETVMAKSHSIIQEKERQLQLQLSEKKRINSELDKLISLHMSGELPQEGFGKHYKPLYEQVQQIETMIPELQAEIDFVKMEYLNSDKIVQEAQNLYGRWKDLPSDNKREIVEQITDSILISNDEIKFRFSYTPYLSKMAADTQRNFMAALLFSAIWEIGVGRYASEMEMSSLSTVIEPVIISMIDRFSSKGNVGQRA
jgi:site-specific DNA recombinase